MDIVLSQVSPNYLAALIRYNKSLQQRNAMLKQEEEPDAQLFESWKK